MQSPVANFVTHRESASALESPLAVRCLQTGTDFDLIPERPHPPQNLVAIFVAKDVLVVERQLLRLGKDVKQHRVEVNWNWDFAPKSLSQQAVGGAFDVVV